MSRANVSAQLAGSEINKYMSYITTVSDVSQLAPESVGTAFKTLYSRYGNVKAGKFVAGAGEESNSEEFEALNDIEKVLNKIGIKMRDTSAEFRNFDDVLADIAEKWVTLTDVEKNAISTAFAGTRLREVFNVLMENFDEIDKFERIAESSAGSTAQKMDIYSDSLEASKNRVTAATEELTQNLFGGNMDNILKTWNDQLAYIIKNGKTLVTLFALLTIIIKGLISGSMFGGLAKLMLSILVSAASFRSTMATAGTNLYNSPIMGAGFRTLSKVTTPIGNGITNVANKVSGSKVGLAVANKAQQTSIWFGQTGVGKSLGELRTNTVNQIRDTNIGKLYTAAYKAGVSGNMDAIQADKSALFISSLLKDPKMFAKFNSLSAESLLKVLNSLSQDEDLIDKSGVTSHLTNIENILSTIATNTASDNVDADNARYAGLKDKYGTDSKGRIQFKRGAKQNGIDNKEVEEDRKFAEKFRRTKNAELAASKKAATADNSEANASYKALNADEQEAYGSLKAAARDQGMTGDDIARTNTLLQDKNVSRLYTKTSKFSGLGSGLMGVGSMAAMMGGTIGGQMAAQNSGQEWTAYTGMGSGLLLSAGLSMGWNPAGWAMMAAGALLGIATAVGAFIKTSEKIQEEAEEARSKLSEGANELKELASEIENLKKQSSGFNKLASGVNPETGENATLSDEEFGQYQDQLKEIINARNELYASYNKEGDLIAMKNGEIIKSNELMEEAIKLAQEEERVKALNLVNDIEEIENTEKSAKGYQDKITNKLDDLKNNIGDTGVSYYGIGSNVTTWEPNLGFGDKDYGYKVKLSDSKKPLYSSGMDVGIYESNMNAGLTVLAGAEYSDDEMEYNVHFKDGYLVNSSTNEVILNANGEAITEENADQYLDLSNSNKNSGTSVHSDELLDIQKSYRESGDLGLMILSLKESNATDEEKALFLGVGVDLLDDILNSDDVLQKIDEIANSIEGFRIEIGNILLTKLSLVVTSIEGVNNLDDSILAFLQNNVKGAKLNKLDDATLKKYMGLMREITVRIVNSPDLQNRLSKYNAETDTLDKALNNLLAYKEAIGSATSDNRVTDGVMRQMYRNAGLEFIDKDGNGKATDLVTKQEYYAYKLKQKDNTLLGYDDENKDNDIWKDLTESELSTFYENTDLVMRDVGVKSAKTVEEKKNALKTRIQEINMESYSILLLFGTLLSDIDKLTKDAGQLWSGTLSDGVSEFSDKLQQQSKAYDKLSKMAKNLGVESVEALAKMSQGLKLDLFGYSTQSMKEILDSFNLLLSIRNTFAKDGTIEAEDWTYLAENFSNVIAKASAEDMIAAMDEALEAKVFLIKAEIKGTLAEDTSIFGDFASIAALGLKSDDNIFKFLNGTNNFKQIEELQSAIALANGDYNLEKQLIAKVFNIDPTQTGWETLLDSTISNNYDGMTYNDFATVLKSSAAIDMKQYWNDYIDPIVLALEELQKLKQDNEAFSNDLDTYSKVYSRGTVSLDQYINKLQSLQNDARASNELLKELAETIEDLQFTKITEQISEGGISFTAARKLLSTMAKNNTVGSDDWDQFVDTAISLRSNIISTNNNRINMLDMTSKEDFDTKRNLKQSNIKEATQKLAEILAAGELEYGKSYNPEKDPRYMSAKEELYNEIKGYTEVFSEEKSYLEAELDRGNVSQQDYISFLDDMVESGELTTQQLKEFKEALEDATLAANQTYFERGIKLNSEGKAVDTNYTGADFRKDLRKSIKNQARDSEDEKTLLETYFSSFDSEISNNESTIELARNGYFAYQGKDKYETEKDINAENVALAYEKVQSLKAAGHDDDSSMVQQARAEAIKWLEADSAVEMQKASDLEEDYQNGSIGLSDFVSGLETISQSLDLTEEDWEKLLEQLEDTRLELAKIKFNDGTINGDEYRVEIMKKIQSNEEGSEDRRNAIQEYISSYDSEVSLSETKASILSDNDFSGKAQYITEDINTLTESLAFMEAAGLQNSEQYYKTISRIVDKKKEELELEKQRYEYEIKKSEEVMDAYSNIISYGIDELQQRQQDINDMYDDEISKLQDINDLKQRSIELTKLQQELENAKKEKVRVYQAGIGFTYQSNKAKVKEAKQNLDQYKDEQKVTDLQHAQEAQNKLFEDQIKRLTDILDYISLIKKTADTTASLMDLKKNRIVPLNATISDAINTITESAINGSNGKIASLDTKFEGFAGNYTYYSGLLAGYTDNLETKLEEIADTYMTYENDTKMVSDFVTQLDTATKAESSPIKTSSNSLGDIDAKIRSFVGENNQTKLSDIDSNVSGVESAVTNKPIPDPTASVDDIKGNVANIKTRLDKLMNEKSSFSEYVTSFKKEFGSVTIDNLSDISSPIDYSSKLNTANKHLKTMSDQLAALMKLNKVLRLGSDILTWYGKNAEYTSTKYSASIAGTNIKTTFYVVKDSKGNFYYTETMDTGSGKVADNAKVYTYQELTDAGYTLLRFNESYNKSDKSYSSGIENGPVTYTGLAMLHGSPSSPEYVLNSDLAGTLLKNLATMTISPYLAPVVDSYGNYGQIVTYQFNGDMNLPNVLKPDQFFDELLKQANVLFPTIKRDYR